MIVGELGSIQAALAADPAGCHLPAAAASAACAAQLGGQQWWQQAAWQGLQTPDVCESLDMGETRTASEGQGEGQAQQLAWAQQQQQQQQQQLLQQQQQQEEALQQQQQQQQQQGLIYEQQHMPLFQLPTTLPPQQQPPIAADEQQRLVFEQQQQQHMQHMQHMQQGPLQAPPPGPHHMGAPFAPAPHPQPLGPALDPSHPLHRLMAPAGAPPRWRPQQLLPQHPRGQLHRLDTVDSSPDAQPNEEGSSSCAADGGRPAAHGL
ncbi:hypothetical protein MNEG_10675 [Monoraphidium neglectum]|uniref:Uncharacterized protein n=1 Tax=Monoraphidium neglectum TaxID=145388 RepID=A0A0D2MRU6_9CHLO|nr:hypothetical protein MNEG_10675 [Monoraphidium neglectum]KIY97290.1 hypothetical protein MNEG_10675 [Monoraphidium neglectum]|eukprot:XP_013896310.1 hypothetical protein MNEG_10675 [Monoraphidium neglectum]